MHQILIKAHHGAMEHTRGRQDTVVTRPDKATPRVIDHLGMRIEELLLEVVQRGIIELKLSLERAVGQAPPALEHGYRLVEDLFKGHGPPSLYQCGVQQTVWEEEKPCGRLYTADG